jgi:hypothetical protein
MESHIYQLEDICEYANDYTKTHDIYKLFPTMKWRWNELPDVCRTGGEYFTYVDSGLIECVSKYNKTTKMFEDIITITLNNVKPRELKMKINELNHFFDNLFEMLFVKFPNHTFEHRFGYDNKNGKHIYNTTIMIEYLDPNTCHKF